jgi:hypothetical protein
MQAISVSITKFVDEHQPGFVECVLIDALGRKHHIIEKVPVVSNADLWSNSEYPQPGFVACNVEAVWKDVDGRSLARVNTAQPWSVESTEGATIFVVLASQVQPHEPHA